MSRSPSPIRVPDLKTRDTHAKPEQLDELRRSTLLDQPWSQLEPWVHLSSGCETCWAALDSLPALGDEELEPTWEPLILALRRLALSRCDALLSADHLGELRAVRQVRKRFPFLVVEETARLLGPRFEANRHLFGDADLSHLSVSGFLLAERLAPCLEAPTVHDLMASTYAVMAVYHASRRSVPAAKLASMSASLAAALFSESGSKQNASTLVRLIEANLLQAKEVATAVDETFEAVEQLGSRPSMRRVEILYQLLEILNGLGASREKKSWALTSLFEDLAALETAAEPVDRLIAIHRGGHLLCRVAAAFDREERLEKMQRARALIRDAKALYDDYADAATRDAARTLESFLIVAIDSARGNAGRRCAPVEVEA